jgi:hypothetical protein
MMMPGYQSILNGIALMGVQKPVYVPDPTLAIGEAENLAPMPVTTTKVYKHPEKYLDEKRYSNSYFGFAGRGAVVDIKDTQSKDYYFGEGVY